MAFTQLTNNLNIIQALDRNPNTNNGLTYAQLQAKFDEAAGLIKTYLNSTLLSELASTTDSSAGADNVGATAITNLTGTTVQALLESLRNNLKATTDGASGADFVNATTITDLAGTTVQALLESLRDILKSTTDGASGADFVNATAIAGIAGTTVQALLESLKSYTDTTVSGVVLGQITDNSLTNSKLGTDIKVGSLASLTTTQKGSVVGAINEIDLDVVSLNAMKRSTYQIFMSGWRF